LVRIDQIVGQMVIDLGIGQIALFQTLADQELDVGLLGGVVVRHVACTRGFLDNSVL